MFGRTADPPGPSAGEELRETRRGGSPAGVGITVRSSHDNLAMGPSGAFPGFLKRRSGYRGQQQRQHGSGSLPGMDTRPSALRMALQGGGDGARRGGEVSVNTDDPRRHQQQRRRGGSSGNESRRRDSTTTGAGSWEFCEPAQPRGSSPVSRPPSVRQRQGELNVSQSRGAGRAGGDSTSCEAQALDSRGPTAGREPAAGGRAGPNSHRDGLVDSNAASFGRGVVAGGKGRAVAKTRSSIRAGGGNVGSNNVAGAYRRTSVAESSTTTTTTSTRRGSGIAFGGNSRWSTNNQADDTMPPPGSTPPRLSSSSGRATSCPSGSPYQEAGFLRTDVGSGGLNTSRGARRINRRGDHDDRNTDSAYSQRSSCCGVGSGKHRDISNDRGHGDGGGGAHTRGYPATAPSGSMSTELDRRLPSIDGLDITGPTEKYPGAGQIGSQENNGGRSSSLAAAEPSLPGQGVLGDESSGPNCSSSSNNSDDRREGGGKEHACVGVSGSSGGGRLDQTGHDNSGGLAAAGDTNSGGDVAPQARRIGTSGGGGSLRNFDQVLGRSGSTGATDTGSNSKNGHKSSSNVRNDSVGSRSSSRECLVGLQNLGNTCFMNACLQCLLHTDALVDLFRRRLHHEHRLSSHNSKSPTRGALAEAFRELVALVEASPAHSNVSPAQVKRLIGKYAPHLSGYGQQDCQEFLRFFLDGLAEDLSRRDSGGHHRGAKGTPHQQDELGAGRGGGPDQQKRSSPPPPPVVPPMSDEEVSRLTAEQQADRAWALHLARNDSEITSMFCGQLQSRISCLGCGNVSFCFDPFFDLSVPLPSDGSRGRAGDEGGGYGGRDARGSYASGGGGGGGRSSTSGASRATATLEDCLRAFSAEETLDGDNRPVCARCRRRRKSTKSLAVHRFPPTLVIHLKRFQYNPTSRTKLSTAVDFPIGSWLDLLPYSTPAARPTSSGSDGSIDEENDADVGGRQRGSSRAASGSSKNGFRAERGRSSSRNGVGSSSSPALYELYAVCNHMGGLQGGHYTAHCRSVSAGEWHTFDDARVGPITTSRVGGASAYVLFYRLVRANPESRG
eukprot:g8235.t1